MQRNGVKNVKKMKKFKTKRKFIPKKTERKMVGSNTVHRIWVKKRRK